MKWLMAGKKRGDGGGQGEVRARREGGMETTRGNERALKRKRVVITPAPSPGFLCDEDFTSVGINLFSFLICLV